MLEMEIPRFEKQNINPRLVPTDIGDAFQAFVQELLQSGYPALHRFPGGGKDGGIDLIECSETCFVVECKVIGEDDYAAVQRRWKEVKKKLGEHTRDPAGPTPGQSQYGPWYPSATPITEYVFCISATLANEEQRRALRKEILEFFQELAQQRTHLLHLNALVVTILDWSDLSTRVRQRPHLLFRWYPAARPNGLVPLDEPIDVGTFRAYLTNAKLPYYSLADHLRTTPAPSGVNILDETSLLQRFENPDITGLVISGKGGIGKSRLTLELGWVALHNGWSVLRVQSRLKDGTLEYLAERLTAETRALLLVDYIETQSDFGELVEDLNVLNDSGVAHIRYVAACRTGYYHQAIAATGRHLPFDLTPPPGAAAIDWFSDYHQQTVAKILAKSGLVITEKHLEVCRDLPVLAVFLIYLHAAGRGEDLAELLTEVEFGRWVAKRLQSSFPSQPVSRVLALLVPLFPMRDSSALELSPDLFRPVFDRFATDGWVEKVPGDGEAPDTWVAAHDVLADQILLSYLRGIPITAEMFLSELFSLAVATGTLASSLVSLQRIADAPPLNAIQWARVITSAIRANELAWRDIRDLLIRTTLLSEPERIGLLRGLDGVWLLAEQEAGFQKSLGWLTRWAVKHELECTEEQKEILRAWISKAVPFAETSNFVISWGLRLAPELAQESALRRISARPTLFQTHYLLVAWLKGGLSTVSIADFVHRWCEVFPHSPHVSFLVAAWLDAGGEPALVADAIKEWLAEHRTAAEASHVYKAWLDAGGERALVADAIKEWLVEHRTAADARFVYKAWLDAGGERALVADTIKEWLVEHRTAADPQFVYKAWLDAGGEPVLVADAIKEWLVENRAAAEANFVYKAWLDAGGEQALIADAIKEWLVEHRTAGDADFVYKAWLDAGGEQALIADAIKEWLVEHCTAAEARFVYEAWLDAGGDMGVVKDALGKWLAVHRERADADHVFRSWLEAGGERELVWDAALDWLALHRLEQSAVYVTKFIARQPDLPASTVRHVLEWCRKFSNDEDSLWRLTQLGSNLFVAGIEHDLISTAETVLAEFLPVPIRLGEITREQVTRLFSYLIDSRGMQVGITRQRVDALFVSWLRHPLSFGNSPTPHPNVQRISFPYRVSALISAGTLDLRDDREPLMRFLQWVNAWDIRWKERAFPVLDELQREYPASELWDIVHY
jgi:hypothetical protein